MLDSILIVIAIEIACILVLLVAIRAARSTNGMRHLRGGEGSVEVSRSMEETESPVAILSRHDVIEDEHQVSKGYSYDDRPVSQGFPKAYLPLRGDIEPSDTEDWLEQEARFFYGPEWDRMSDREKEDAIGFMTLYTLDMELFGDADGDGLPDHPDWDPDFEDDGDWFDFGFF